MNRTARNPKSTRSRTAAQPRPSAASKARDYRHLAEHLSHVASPVRLGILMQLESGGQTSEELCAAVGCGKSLLSRHTTYLRYAGFIVARRDGLQILYSATPAGRAMQRVVHRLLDE